LDGALDVAFFAQYVHFVIRSFADRRTARLFQGVWVQGMHPDLQRRARTKLRELDAARSLDELARRAGNRLEKLTGDRQGQWSIRVTGQWRICFEWAGHDAAEVWFGDYH
jgi:proteic killer suppression protein